MVMWFKPDGCEPMLVRAVVEAGKPSPYTARPDGEAMAKKKTARSRAKTKGSNLKAKGTAKSRTPKKPASTPKAQPQEIRFYYLKSNQFRVVHVDGAHGGITPRGHIQMALFSERAPIPRETVQNEKGKEILEKRVQRNGLIREVEIEAILTLETAKVLKTWLDQRIQSLEELRKKMEVVK